MVPITDDGFPQMQCSIGRVMHLKPGHIGLARVASVGTARDEFTMTVNKLRRLPVKDNELHSANVDCLADKE